MKDKGKVLIAGAGIGGLTAALALLRRGFDVEVYEQASQLGEVGAGIQVSANGTRALHELGLKQQLETVVSLPAGKEIRLWSTGQSWKLFDLGAQSIERYGSPYYTVHRADLHNVLADAVRKAKPDAIHLNSGVLGCAQSEREATLFLSDGRSVRGDALIGADGVHSKIRQALHGADEPVFSGCVAWRGVADASQLEDRLRRPVGVNWVGPGRHVIQYPLRGGKLINFVGIVERSDWQVESWSQKGTVDECLGDFPGWHEDVHTLIRAVGTPFKWALMGRKPLPRWSEGRISLLGDACHPTLPFLAQGAVMAIEDGFVLARCFEANSGDPVRALARYENARIERTAKIVTGSAENTRRFHNPALKEPVGAQAYVDREWAEDAVKSRYDWLFRYDVAAVAV